MSSCAPDNPLNNPLSGVPLASKSPSGPNTSVSAQIGLAGNPWNTVSNQFIPKNLKDIIKWSKYITLQSPVTTEVIRKMATYPVTDFIVNSNDSKVKERYLDIIASFKLRQVLQSVGFSYFSIGNVFLSVYFPIHRVLECPSCKNKISAKKAKHLKVERYNFKGSCTKCGFKGVHKIVDTKSVNVQDMNIISWDPEYISVQHNPITGESEYFYSIPPEVRNKIEAGDRLFFDSTPLEFIIAVEKQKSFKFDKDNIFHLKNVSTGHTLEGVSLPPLVSLYNLIFYQATLRKANEAIALEHLNPMRVIFPSANAPSGDPIGMMSLANFTRNVQQSLARHKRDPNHILIAPVPVGYQNIGGEGRSLLVAQEIDQAEQSILLSQGVSRELLSGTTNWTSSTVGLRMMDSALNGYSLQLNELLAWVFNKVSSYLNFEYIEVSLAPFKLVDDENKKVLLQSLASGGLASYSTMFESLGLDYNEELKKIVEDNISKAKTDIDSEFKVSQAQFIAAKAVASSLKDSEDYKTLMERASSTVETLTRYPEGPKRTYLNQLRVGDFPLYCMVSKMLEGYTKTPDHAQENQSGAQEIAENSSGQQSGEPTNETE